MDADELSSVDITALRQGAFIHVGLNNGRTLHLEVADPASGAATLFVDGFPPLQVTFTNEAGQHVLSVDDDLVLGDKAMPFKVTTLQVQENAMRIEISVPDGSPADLAELAQELKDAGLPELTVTMHPRRTGGSE